MSGALGSTWREWVRLEGRGHGRGQSSLLLDGRSCLEAGPSRGARMTRLVSILVPAALRLPGWSPLVIVQPATVLAWHRQGFQLYWRWKSRRRSAGRPPLHLELRTLIRRMARENPTWGRRRIQAELRFLSFEVAELTVAKYMRRPSPRPSST